MAALTKSAVAVIRHTKRFLSTVPALRRLHYSIVNADLFENLFWHDVMLANSVRMEKYIQAMEKYVHPGTVVADLGTGSGVLACLAAKRGAKVYAIEHGAIIEHARTLARANGLSQNIEFVHAHSKDFNPPEKVDFIVHEQVGMALIDEDMAENVVELRDRVLKQGGKVLPGSFELFIDPVQTRDDRRLPYIWEQRIGGVDFSSLKPDALPWTSGKGYDKRALEPDDVSVILAHRNRVLELDLNAPGRPVIPEFVQYDTVIQQDGRLDGFCLYFSNFFDKELGFYTGPKDSRTHWACRLLRTEAREVKKGQHLHFEMRIPNVTNTATWTWDYKLS
jgi:protein arginine N-methyltransferase 1